MECRCHVQDGNVAYVLKKASPALYFSVLQFTCKARKFDEIYDHI